MDSRKRSKEANRITWISVFWEIVLILLKLSAGLIGRSSALIADAFHSISDLASDIILLISFQIVKKPVDDNHHYGHGKFETLSAILISIMIFIASGGIIWNGFLNVFNALQGALLPKPGIFALIAAIISVVIKESLFQISLKVSRKIDSPALHANAWHHRSDAFSSIAAFCGVSGAIFFGETWRILDPIAAILVGLFILRVAFLLGKESLDELLEASLDDHLNLKILSIVKEVPGANNPHNLKTRKIGKNIAMDLHIKVADSLSIIEAHDIATQVENVLRKEFGKDTFISIHMEPQ
jgi:cation diffusion facilitator family transporter